MMVTRLVVLIVPGPPPRTSDSPAASPPPSIAILVVAGCTLFRCRRVLREPGLEEPTALIWIRSAARSLRPDLCGKRLELLSQHGVLAEHLGFIDDLCHSVRPVARVVALAGPGSGEFRDPRGVVDRDVERHLAGD